MGLVLPVDLEVFDGGITLTGQVQNAGVGVVVGHEDTSGLINITSVDGFVEHLGVIDVELASGIFAETDCADEFMIVKEDEGGLLLPGATISGLARAATRIEDANLLVLACGTHQGTVGIPSNVLGNFTVLLEFQNLGLSLDIPQLDSVVERGSGQDVVGSRVPFCDVNLLLVALQGGDRFLDIRGETISGELGNLDIAVLTAGGDQVIIERVEREVQNLAFVDSDLFRPRNTTNIGHRENNKRSSTTCAGISQVFATGLHEITITARLGANVSVRLIGLSRLTMHMAIRRCTNKSAAHIEVLSQTRNQVN